MPRNPKNRKVEIMSVDDLILKDSHTSLQFANDEHGVTLLWDWEGCNGSLWLKNEHAQALGAWLAQRTSRPEGREAVLAKDLKRKRRNAAVDTSKEG